MKQFTLSRHERLKSRKQIDHLFSSGKYFNFPPLRVIYEVGKTELPPPPRVIDEVGKMELPPPPRVVDEVGKKELPPPPRVVDEVGKMQLPQPLQFGVGVSARHFKKAVDRNRVKRLLREAWRVQKIPLHNQLREKGLVLRLFVIYTGRELPDYELVSAKMSLSIQRLAIVINETDPAHT